jgi:ribosomal protein S18 acetylase RimI-like enzyme
MSTLSRRPALPSDTEWTRGVHHRAYRDVVVRQFGKWDQELQDQFFETDWNRQRFEILLGDGVPCGYHSFKDEPDHVQTGEIVVDPEFQNCGIGTWVLQSLIERGRSRGVPVRIGALHQNRALALYRRHGFKHFARSETHTCLVWQPDERPA